MVISRKTTLDPFFGHLLEPVYVNKQMPSFVPELAGKIYVYVSRSDNIMASAVVALKITVYVRIFRADAYLRYNAVAFDTTYKFNALL